MPAPTITPELKKDLQLLKLRSVLDPKRHYKKGDSKSKTLPKFFQMGTVIEPASEYYTGRLSKKERKNTLADELLSDSNLTQYRYEGMITKEFAPYMCILAVCLILGSGNGKFRRLKKKTDLGEWTSGRLGASNQGNVQRKEDIDCSVLEEADIALLAFLYLLKKLEYQH
ncbi:OLC1v1030307C1 [Oldenlandia corymbosa var. corymbosa]|uniref:OLC1v1030307C1 n=1 Tax=Oldenlandia corymbosa var. corymbosa TaxID=529605 RepID=A0AAV1CJ73_OLDCO|nr:OLC1v1030307C1 [Oldenlandia corymbosa var. corymbosa]